MFQLYEGGLRQNVPITGIHSSGKSIGVHEGKNLYTDFTIPGEVADIRLDRKKRGFYSGIAENILQPSEHRIPPTCKHFNICGGCNWQHINYAHQLTLKRQILENALVKYDISYPDLPEVIPSPQLTNYRNKIEYAFAENGIAQRQDSIEYVKRIAGFHPLGRRDLTLQIDECSLQQEPGWNIYNIVLQCAQQSGISFYDYASRSGVLRNLVVRTTSAGGTMVIIGFTEEVSDAKQELLTKVAELLPHGTSLYYTMVPSSEKGYMDGEIVGFYNATGYLQETIENLNFRYGPKSFYQPNPEQARVIYAKVSAMADLNGSEFIVDLYTGVGTIASCVAKQANKVLGIEGSEEAIRFANINKDLNQIGNAEFMVGDILGTFTPAFVDKIGKPDIIILDPPRSGTLIEIKKTILYAAPRKIIYVSCNPVSLAFDLTMLTQGYTVKEIQGFDMFPNTHHLETIVLLEKSCNIETVTSYKNDVNY